MVFETKEENKENRFGQYMLFGKTENSWQFQGGNGERIKKTRQTFAMIA